jgi:acetyl esterase/lipase
VSTAKWPVKICFHDVTAWLRLSAIASIEGIALLTLLLATLSCADGQIPPSLAKAEVVRIWPRAAPGTQHWAGEETQLDADLPGAGKVHIITNVTVPSFSVFRPPVTKANGTAMIVAPGGAFRALAWDLEGTEVARWLVERGITAFVLKYRVRPPLPNEKADERFEAARAIAIQDAQQALHLIRESAGRYGVATDRIGVIGFSAGAVTAMGLALSTDASARPDFAVSAYGGIPAGRGPVPGGPPVFIVAARDDPQVSSAESVNIYQKWAEAKLPVELHLYEKGGHGFGMRTRNLPIDGWPKALESWLLNRGYIVARREE